MLSKTPLNQRDGYGILINFDTIFAMEMIRMTICLHRYLGEATDSSETFPTADRKMQTEHRQKIETQLEEIINDYDQFQQIIVQQKQNPHNSSLIQQINQWETNSIHQIRQTAEECREKVMKSTEKNNNDMEKKFNELSQKLKQIREENEFNEIDLNNFQLKLTQISDEFLQRSDISI
ncbi:unnamed protein product [Adineta steineri]|uniref:Uncharacterized protein n=1 Tax=Adineta steineri TaxID=433720 RepID=A0A814VIG0_9BILA|nr:unnamed protein product [Adineta steineri]CAF3713299.1 unnamed protein product [Adineta steineri]